MSIYVRVLSSLGLDDLFMKQATKLVSGFIEKVVVEGIASAMAINVIYKVLFTIKNDNNIYAVIYDINSKRVKHIVQE